MKRKNFLRYILLPLLLILAAAAIYFYIAYNRTHKDTSRLRTDYTVSATGLIREFETGNASANKKYWDKVLEVEGVVKALIRDDNGFYTIVLGDMASLSSVRCSIDSMHQADAAIVEKGKQVTIKGICTGFNEDPLLGSDIILVRSMVHPTRSFTKKVIQ